MIGTWGFNASWWDPGIRRAYRRGMGIKTTQEIMSDVEMQKKAAEQSLAELIRGVGMEQGNIDERLERDRQWADHGETIDRATMELDDLRTIYTLFRRHEGAARLRMRAYLDSLLGETE